MAVTKKDIFPLLPKIVREQEYVRYVNRRIKTKVEEIKEEILKEFNNHPVTVEIVGGVSSSNISGTLNGITNLFSFIGFDSGEKPIDPIRRRIEQIAPKFRISPTGIITYTIEFPTAKDIFEITPLPWAPGRSWAKGIETGISGIGYYIKKVSNSRSGLGIQSKKPVRTGVRFQNTQYISSLINKYTKEIQKLEKLTL